MTQSFWLIILAVIAWGFVHSFLASLPAKSLAQRWFGASVVRWYRLVYNLFAGLSLLPVLRLALLSRGQLIYSIHLPWLLFTSLIQFLAVLAVLFAIRQTGSAAFIGAEQLLHSTDTSPATLVTGGLYGYVRHPISSAGLIFIWCVPIMSWNILALVIGLTIYFFAGAWVEERKLLREYGEAYAAYRRHTPMFIPGLNFNRRR